jgi:hypothetical protein
MKPRMSGKNALPLPMSDTITVAAIHTEPLIGQAERNPHSLSLIATPRFCAPPQIAGASSPRFAGIAGLNVSMIATAASPIPNDPM